MNNDVYTLSIVLKNKKLTRKEREKKRVRGIATLTERKIEIKKDR